MAGSTPHNLGRSRSGRFRKSTTFALAAVSVLAVPAVAQAGGTAGIDLVEPGVLVIDGTNGVEQIQVTDGGAPGVVIVRNRNGIDPGTSGCVAEAAGAGCSTRPRRFPAPRPIACGASV